MQVPRAVEWVGGSDGFLRLLDQTRLPTELVYHECRSLEEVWEAIRVLRVRGAPAIGVAAAFGLVLWAQRNSTFFAAAVSHLAGCRPTAVNLHHALARMQRRW